MNKFWKRWHLYLCKQQFTRTYEQIGIRRGYLGRNHFQCLIFHIIDIIFFYILYINEHKKYENLIKNLVCIFFFINQLEDNSLEKRDRIYIDPTLGFQKHLIFKTVLRGRHHISGLCLRYGCC